MDKCRTHIAIIEPSDIIYEGLTQLMLKNENHFYVFRITQIDELEFLCKKEQIDAVIINPSSLINRMNDYIRLKKNLTKTSWIGLIYAYYDHDILAKFDEILNIGEPTEEVIKKIDGMLEKRNCNESSQEELSERERDVLVLLVKGLSNKEIADQLHISVHTVISHRKNIMEKTSIKSLPGLTIYAISKKIVPFNTL